MKRILIITLMLLQNACAHKITEREAYAEGVREGFRLGIQAQNVPVAESTPVPGKEIPPQATKAEESEARQWLIDNGFLAEGEPMLGGDAE